MTTEEKDKCWDLLMRLGGICGDLACTISDDPEARKWLAVDAKYTRDRLMKIQEDFIRDLGLDRE